MFEKLVCIMSFIMVTLSPVSAAPVVRVDLSQSGDVERGWIDWNTNDNRLGNEDVSRQFINEADFDDNFTIDFIKIDSRNRDDMDDSVPMHDLIEDAFKESSPFDMVIKDLVPGVYTITTYHHDPAEDVQNDDGTLNITIQDADGTRLAVDHLAAAAADRHATGPAEGQAAVEVVLDELQPLQHRHVVGERHVVALVPRLAVGFGVVAQALDGDRSCLGHVLSLGVGRG